jgi:hypothetical protein
VPRRLVGMLWGAIYPYAEFSVRPVTCWHTIASAAPSISAAGRRAMSGRILRAIDYYRKRDDSSVRCHTYKTTILDGGLADALDRHGETDCRGENMPVLISCYVACRTDGGMRECSNELTDVCSSILAEGRRHDGDLYVYRPRCSRDHCSAHSFPALKLPEANDLAFFERSKNPVAGHPFFCSLGLAHGLDLDFVSVGMPLGLIAPQSADNHLPAASILTFCGLPSATVFTVIFMV